MPLPKGSSPQADAPRRRWTLSFNTIGSPDANVLGMPLVELDVERFTQPITTYTGSYFLTARLWSI